MSLNRAADDAAAHPAGQVPADAGRPPQNQDHVKREAHPHQGGATEAPAEPSPADAEREAKVAWCRSEWARGKMLEGTPGERYLAGERGVAGPWPTSAKWLADYRIKPEASPQPCLLIAVTDTSGEIVALHSIELEPSTGRKSKRTDNPKLSRGPVGEGTARLSGDAASPVLVLGEGVETTLSRVLVGPCEAHACLGALRFVEPAPHHRRVELLADRGAEERARRLAKRYAAGGKVQARGVTVPDSLGPKADLNTILLEQGRRAVQIAVEDAELYLPGAGGRRGCEYQLEIGSDVEIAQQTLDKLEEVHGTVVVVERSAWRFDRTHWVAVEDDTLARLIHKADGAPYSDGIGSSGTVRLSRNRVASILDAMLLYRRQDDYFATPPPGINCVSGFIRVDAAGGAELLPHARGWRQRHVVRGRYPCRMTAEDRRNSLLTCLLRDTFQGDADAKKRIALVAELLGCTALGWGTRLRNPKAVVAYSDEGGTGKSTLLDLLRALPNPEAVASVPPGRFGDDRHACRLVGKVLNAADELPARAVRSDVFKKMITGEPVTGRDVYRSGIDFRPVALHVFSTNVLPDFQGGVDGGVLRRLLPLPFNRVVPEGKRIPGLGRWIAEEEADLLLKLTVWGAVRLMRQGDFTVPSTAKELLDAWASAADPVRAWVKDRLEEANPLEVGQVAVAVLYDDFRRWALGRQMRVDSLPSNIAFGKRIYAAAPWLNRHRTDGSKITNARLRRLS